MPRQALLTPRRRESTTNALVASAARYSGTNVPQTYQGAQAWQTEAWRLYDITGELRFASNWMANMLSRATLFPATATFAGPVAQDPKSKAGAALASLFGGVGGQPQMLSAFGLHLTVAGEAFLVGRTIDGDDTWQVLGCQEVRNSGNRWYIDYGIGAKQIELTEADVVIRIWRPHPRRYLEADSPVRALLPVLSELELLTRHVAAQVSSRLVGAGIYTLPEGVTFPPPPDDMNLPPDASTADQFVAMLTAAMMTAIKAPGDPSSMVPIVITVPDELVGKADLMRFWTELDQHAIEMRTEAIRRFALGMDMPPEIVLGMGASRSAGGTGGGMNHWSAWQVDESSIKVHVEPALQVITQGLTAGYIYPATKNPTDTIGFDTANLKLRPDRSKESVELFDRGELAGKVMLRENGFADEDAMTEDERRDWLLRKVASGSTTPDQVADALRSLGVTLVSSTQKPTEARPTPSLNDHPPPRATPIPKRKPVDPALVAVAEAMVFRALERAGNRLRSVTGQKPPGLAADAYLTLRRDAAHGAKVTDLLEDAWSCAPRLLLGIAEPEPVVAALDNYCRGLLTECRPHQRDELVAALQVLS
jgi:hypothetical protein